MIKKLTYPLLLLVLASLFYSGCVKNETCLPANNFLYADFYYSESDTVDVATTVDSLSLYIIGREDSVLYDNEKDLGSVSIPLSDDLTEITVVIKINDAVDTLYIKYNPYSVFRSTECGVINRYEIADPEFTDNRIIKITNDNNTVDETEAVNFLMYLDLD